MPGAVDEVVGVGHGAEPARDRRDPAVDPPVAGLSPVRGQCSDTESLPASEAKCQPGLTPKPTSMIVLVSGPTGGSGPG